VAPRLRVSHAVMPMNVLALNCGSSTIKFRLFHFDRADDLRALAHGSIERFGHAASVNLATVDGAAVHGKEGIADHAAGIRRVVEWIGEAVGRPGAVGHRVVHGGARFIAPAIVDDKVVAAIEQLATLAPLHNTPGLAGIRAARTLLDVPMVAVFDTAFHATLPEAARTYAIPHGLADAHGIRRYGFHGLSYRAVVARYAAVSGVPSEASRLVVLHLGNGASAAAIAGGRSVDTSMGLTPLEGLVMGTRSGDVDPAIVAYLSREAGVEVQTVGEWLNERSGLLGLSGRSADVRDLLSAEPHDPHARLALEVFCHRARKYIGAYLAVLGGADAVIFTGGIGEHAPEIRARICRGLDWFGLVLDGGRNDAARGSESRISGDGARVAAWVIPTDEERVIADDTVACLAARVEARP
jgi:acetate kinase